MEPLKQPVSTKTRKGFLRSLLCCLRQKKTKTQIQEQSVDGSTYSERTRGAYLLKPALPEDADKKCMVIDLDETLVHSSFKVGGFGFLFFKSFLGGIVKQQCVIYVLQKIHKSYNFQFSVKCRIVKLTTYLRI